MADLEKLREKVALRISRSEDVAIAMEDDLYHLFGPIQARVICGIAQCIIEQDRDFLAALVEIAKLTGGGESEPK